MLLLRTNATQLSQSLETIFLSHQQPRYLFYVAFHAQKEILKSFTVFFFLSHKAPLLS